MIVLWFKLAILYICSISVQEYSNETALSAELFGCEVSLPIYLLSYSNCSIILWMAFAPRHCKTICSHVTKKHCIIDYRT